MVWCGGEKGLWGAYKKPIAKMPTTRIFWRRGSFSGRTKGMGRMKIIRSVTIVILAREVSVCAGVREKGVGLATDPVFAHQASWGWQNVGMTVKSQVA